MGSITAGWEGERMDPVTLIVTALAAGAASALQDGTAVAVKDAYARLRALVRKRFAGRPKAELVLAEHEAAPQTWEAPLAAELSAAGVEGDDDLVAAAQALMSLVDEAGSRLGKYAVTISESQGFQVGDHNTQTVNIYPSGTGPEMAPELEDPTVEWTRPETLMPDRHAPDLLEATVRSKSKRDYKVSAKCRPVGGLKPWKEDSFQLSAGGSHKISLGGRHRHPGRHTEQRGPGTLRLYDAVFLVLETTEGIGSWKRAYRVPWEILNLGYPGRGLVRMIEIRYDIDDCLGGRGRLRSDFPVRRSSRMRRYPQVNANSRH